MSTLTFDELNLNTDLQKAISNAQLNEATSLQQAIIAHAKNDNDLLICTDDEEDKYLAFAVAALEKLSITPKEDDVRVLIIVPHPDAARQICARIETLNDAENIAYCIDDDGDIEAQAEAIAQKTPILVANPNRLQDLLQQHRFIFRALALLVIDGMGDLTNQYKDELKQIKRRIISDCTTIVCAKDADAKTKQALSSFIDEPSIVGFGETVQTPPAIRGDLHQQYINVPNRMKISTLMAHIEQTSTDKCVIFTASKRGTDRLYRVLKKRGLKATSLHQKLSDKKRAQRFANFTNSDVAFLLVSDFSAAELDVVGVNQVINYDVPNSSDEYRFRAGLVGNNGHIVSLVSQQDQSDISQLENELGQTPREIPLPEKVKQKLKQRKTNKNKNKTSRNNSRSKKSRQQKKQKDREMQLPQPSYDKLSGGRSGNYNKKETGIVKFFKKLFS